MEILLLGLAVWIVGTLLLDGKMPWDR